MKNEAYLPEEIAGKYAFYVGTVFGHFYQEYLLAEDRFEKEDLVKNAFLFFRQSVKFKGFFDKYFFFPMKTRFGLIRVLSPISSALSCKVQILLALESAIIVFILVIHLSLDVNFFI